MVYTDPTQSIREWLEIIPDISDYTTRMTIGWSRNDTYITFSVLCGGDASAQPDSQTTSKQMGALYNTSLTATPNKIQFSKVRGLIELMIGLCPQPPDYPVMSGE
jgi:hypothetical protein